MMAVHIYDARSTADANVFFHYSRGPAIRIYARVCACERVNVNRSGPRT